MDDHLKQNAPIEGALASRPLAKMPRSVTADVLARIQTEARPSLLTWSDFFLSIVIAFCIAALWFAAQNLPPIMLAKIRIQAILLYQDILVNARWLVPSTLFGLAAALAAVTIPALLKMAMKSR